MAPSFDCAAASLLCAEDNAVISDDEEYGSETTTHYSPPPSHRNHRNRVFADELTELPLLQSDDVLGSMLDRECHHSPASDYSKRLKSGDLDLLSRNLAVDWVFKVCFLIHFDSRKDNLFFAQYSNGLSSFSGFMDLMMGDSCFSLFLSLVLLISGVYFASRYYYYFNIILIWPWFQVKWWSANICLFLFVRTYDDECYCPVLVSTGKCPFRFRTPLLIFVHKLLGSVLICL